MADKKVLTDDLNKLTEKISSQVWTLNLGTLGTTWSLLVASGFPESIRFTTRNAIWVFVPCLLSLLFEMGQYLPGYALDRRLLQQMELSGATDFQYPTGDWLYKARDRCFSAKIVLTIAATLILVFTVVRKLVV